MKQLYRFKSNPNTIVADVDDSNLVQIIWAECWRMGIRSGFLYRRDPANLTPLNGTETKEILDKRAAIGVTSPV